MSRYIYTHPKEAYKDECKVVRKTCHRRGYSRVLECILLMKAYITWRYRSVRLLVKPK